MVSKWNLFVKKIFNEGRKKNPAFSFGDALKEASRRKGEMGSIKNASLGKKSRKVTKGKKGKKHSKTARR